MNKDYQHTLDPYVCSYDGVNARIFIDRQGKITIMSYQQFKDNVESTCRFTYGDKEITQEELDKLESLIGVMIYCTYDGRQYTNSWTNYCGIEIWYES